MEDLNRPVYEEIQITVESMRDLTSKNQQNVGLIFRASVNYAVVDAWALGFV